MWDGHHREWVFPVGHCPCNTCSNCVNASSLLASQPVNGLQNVMQDEGFNDGFKFLRLKVNAIPRHNARCLSPSLVNFGAEGACLAPGELGSRAKLSSLGSEPDS